MRTDLCRKCGIEPEVEKKCFVCYKPVTFLCRNCNRSTDEQIHIECKRAVIQVPAR